MSEISAGKKRIAWVDFLKGFGIILVVIGHSGIPSNMSWWIWSFHMPLFFFISGYLFQRGRDIEVKKSVKRKFQTLIIPYIFFSLILMALLPLLSKFLPTKLEFDSYDQIPRLVLFGWKGLALWFLPVLFLTETAFLLINKLIDMHPGAFVIIMLLLALLGFLLSEELIRLPYKLEVVPTALVFYCIGYYIKPYIQFFLDKKLSWRKLFSLVLLSLTVNLFFCFSNNERFDMCFNKLGFLPFSYISSLSGIVFSLILCFLSSESLRSSILFKKIIIYIGQNSIIILGIHQLLKISLTIMSSFFLPSFIINAARQLMFWGLLLILIKTFDKYFYFIFGRKKTSAH